VFGAVINQHQQLELRGREVRCLVFDGVKKPFPQFARVLTAEHFIVVRVWRDAKLDVSVFGDKGVASYLRAAAGHEQVTFAWFKRLVVPSKYQGVIYPRIPPGLLNGHGPVRRALESLLDPDSK
jgi:hypothetical protein